MTRALALCELAPYHHDELSRMGLADLGEKLPHPDRVHLAAQPPIQLAFQRGDRAIDVHKFPFVAIVEHRAQEARRPAPLGAPSVRTGPRPETSSAPAGVPPPPGSAGLPTCPGVFFHAAWATRSCWGCWVSGATRRHPCRASRRYTTEAATFCPKCSASAARSGETTNTPALRACSTHGARKACSSSRVMSARRRPAHRFGADWGSLHPSRNRCWSRGTVARPTPSRAAASSKVVRAKAGRRMGWAARRSFRSVA